MKKVARVFAVGALVIGPLLAGTLACDPPAPYAKCGDVSWPTPGFAHATSQGAWEIKAHDTTCTTARWIATKEWLAGPKRPYANGSWSCTAGLPSGWAMQSYAIWCNGPRGAVVTFVWAT